MNPKRKQKLIIIIIMLSLLSVAVGLTLFALKQNIDLFYTPTQVHEGQAPKQRIFRVGGLVEKGSVQRGNDLSVQFVITDLRQRLTIHYQGILPDLFREGQGVVVQGELNNQGVFAAQQVLAKHDENYMPPEVKDALKQAKKAS